MSRYQKGFAALELVLVLVVVGIIGFVAWRIMGVQETVDTTKIPQDTVSQNDAAQSVPTPASSKDLDTLGTQLDGTDVEGKTLTDLDTESSF